jgi:hypothetical protein
MTLDELIARLTVLREEYPQLAAEHVFVIVRDGDRLTGLSATSTCTLATRFLSSS